MPIRADARPCGSFLGARNGAVAAGNGVGCVPAARAAYRPAVPYGAGRCALQRVRRTGGGRLVQAGPQVAAFGLPYP